jgi:peptidylprolyl isomerase
MNKALRNLIILLVAIFVALMVGTIIRKRHQSQNSKPKITVPEMTPMQEQTKGDKNLAVKYGDSIKIHYTGKLDNGKVFDTSLNREPLKMTIGAGQLIPGFEEGVVGLKIGETKTLKIPFAKAYGPRRKELLRVIAKSNLPKDVPAQLGLQFNATDDKGNKIPLTITKVEGDKVTLDANHPLAGRNLTFDVKLVEIVS